MAVISATPLDAAYKREALVEEKAAVSFEEYDEYAVMVCVVASVRVDTTTGTPCW